MKDSDKNLLKNSAIVAVDSIASTIDNTYNSGMPLISGAWGLAKALFGNALEIQKQKAIEWLEMVRNNPEIFSKDIVKTQEFIDAFVISLENYIKQRNKKKRDILREIFKDYTKSVDKEDYSLERYNSITEQITIKDAEKFNSLVQQSKKYKTGSFFQDSNGNSIESIESINHLISLGLLIRDYTPRMISDNPKIQNPNILISTIGLKYYIFIAE